MVAPRRTDDHILPDRPAAPPAGDQAVSTPPAVSGRSPNARRARQVVKLPAPPPAPTIGWQLTLFAVAFGLGPCRHVAGQKTMSRVFGLSRPFKRTYSWSDGDVHPHGQRLPARLLTLFLSNTAAGRYFPSWAPSPG
jgi:hypothetical protein